MKVLPTGADWSTPDQAPQHPWITAQLREAEAADHLREAIVRLIQAVDLLDP